MHYHYLSRFLLYVDHDRLPNRFRYWNKIHKCSYVVGALCVLIQVLIIYPSFKYTGRWQMLSQPGLIFLIYTNMLYILFWSAQLIVLITDYDDLREEDRLTKADVLRTQPAAWRRTERDFDFFCACGYSKRAAFIKSSCTHWIRKKQLKNYF